MSQAPISASPQLYYLRPAPGWVDVLYEEVNEILRTPLQKYKFEAKTTLLRGAVKLHRCDSRQGLEVLLRLTTAHDMEWMLIESKCGLWTEVDAILKRVRWDDVLPERHVPVHVTPEVFDSFTTSSAGLRERLCKIAKLTHVSENAEYRFKIELRGERLRVSVSLGGKPLYQRGYKARLSAVAPLPEHHAAAMVRWVMARVKNPDAVKTVLVPFAGTGTLGFEALLALSGSGPGSFSRTYLAEKFPSTPEATVQFLRRKLKTRLAESTPREVWFNDFNPDILPTLRENIVAFPAPKKVQVVEGDFFAVEPNLSGEGLILALLNPPFGDRLAKESDIGELYGRLGRRFRELRTRFPHSLLGGCLCPDETSWRNFLWELGDPKADTHHFTHGGREMRLVRWAEA